MDHAHGQVEILDLDAEVLREHTDAIAAWLPLVAAPRHVVDLGCGTGAGAFALLDRLPEAWVTAVDSSAKHLRHLREKACARGVEGRVRVVQADLDDATWPELGSADLVWASASMHHMARPGEALRHVRELIGDEGLFAVVEVAGFPRFLPADDHAPGDRPGLEERAHRASERRHAGHLAHRGADWGPMLVGAGFDVVGERSITVDIGSSRDNAVSEYALSSLRRLRQGVEGALPYEDVLALDRLLDVNGADSILRRGDLAVRTERRVWAARRAGCA